MALQIPFKRCIFHCLRINTLTGINSLRYKNNFHDRMLTMEEDSLDEFTTQLLQKKIEKWSARKTVPKISVDIKQVDDPTHNISDLGIDKINNLFHEAIEYNDNSQILELIEQCISIKVCPSTSNILYTLTVCSQSGNIISIRNIEKLCRQQCPEVLAMNSNFRHFVAEAIWVKGNTNEALILFREVYKENTFLRRKIRLMLKNLIVGVVANRSEVILHNTMKFAEELAKEYKDFYPLACIWQTCFLSEWFTDQCLALDLLNKYNELFKAVVHRIPYVVAVSLHNHQAEVVYRLLEILLKFEMKSQYVGVLLALLDYQIHQKNIRRCVEIVRWSEQNDIELLPIHHQKYLKLLLSYKDDILDIKNKKPIKPPRLKTHFKF
ncbi:unnamed protein product [Psylliodes chrysocephalus]|uniref:Uncharacterized protein n=1 Tax=Psylliodes chrysocephalus TaxID=3402493 RepID=A0A9P0CM08_9CUCU|nr:unnamed protein product [Psylliodes chrysocephala]